ncbi:endo-1,4-beta-xylanase 5-like [Nicotiana tabacum]|uniref:Endo-1,4-beta-xylanase 5-like n=1 Tax=Nicotiana tabacum TaxID=4097 RepID=A0A1S4BND9_TOBAC
MLMLKWGISPLLWTLFPFIFFATSSQAKHDDGPVYDSSAWTECQADPEAPLYNGGILVNKLPEYKPVKDINGDMVNSPTFTLQNLSPGSFYSFSSWVRVKNADSALISATIKVENTFAKCIGSVIAKKGCWSFLKGGFRWDSPSTSSQMDFQNSDRTRKNVEIELISYSLQPFKEKQWRKTQFEGINTERKRAVTVHVVDENGFRLPGAAVKVKQISTDFPFGCAVSKTILGNLPYQEWFAKRFKATVFENELKWYKTEPQLGQFNYTLVDQMMEFVRKNKLIARGHNMFWDDPVYIQDWLENMTAPQLKQAMKSRIKSVISKYRNEFVHWDVNNELLHFNFYEGKLGPNATLDMFKKVHREDPLATLFLNEYNVVERCDSKASVDRYIEKFKELKNGGVTVAGIGLESHFAIPNPPFMRAVLDKLATLKLPIWLTEVDVSKMYGLEEQAMYLEQILREGFSHPSVNGIMLWTSRSVGGCYQTCLTDEKFQNLPTGDVVDKLLLKEWQTKKKHGKTDEFGSYSFRGFLGEYNVSVVYNHKVINSYFSLGRGVETKHITLQI